MGSHKYPWLADDGLRGFHCSRCIKVSNTLKANDKLSTTGYGPKNPLPAVQKLEVHAAHTAHKAVLQHGQSNPAVAVAVALAVAIAVALAVAVAVAVAEIPL